MSIKKERKEHKQQNSKTQCKKPTVFLQYLLFCLSRKLKSLVHVNCAGPGSYCSASAFRSKCGLKRPHQNNFYENETTQFQFSKLPLIVIRAPGFSCEACTNFAKGRIGRSSITAALRHAIAYNSA